MNEEENIELELNESENEKLETEEEQIQSDASEGEEQVQEETEENEETQETEEKEVKEDKTETKEEKRYTQEELNIIIENRFAREARLHEREMAKYKELENIMKHALEANDINDIISKSKTFYKEQGIDIPEYKTSLNTKDEEILAKAYAEEIISTGDYSEMEYEANKIASIPADKRTVRENVMFNMLCQELMENKNRKILQEKGYDVNLLNDEKFKGFRQKLNYNTPITEAVEMFKRLNAETKAEKPYSVGSAKNKVKVNEIKEYYTPEDFDKLTMEDLKNPKIMEAVDRSRLKWYN